MAELTKEFLDSEIAGLQQGLAQQERALALAQENVARFMGAIHTAQKLRAHLDIEETPPLRAVDAETDSKENEHGSS